MDFHWVVHAQADSCHAPGVPCPCWEGEGLTRHMLFVFLWFPCLRSVLGQSWGCRAQRNPCDREPDVGQKRCNYPYRDKIGAPQALLPILQQWHCCPDLLVHAVAIFGVGIHSLEVSSSSLSLCPSSLSACSPMAVSGKSTALELSVLGLEGAVCPWAVRS